MADGDPLESLQVGTQVPGQGALTTNHVVFSNGDDD
jgi:hypothetical protein